MPHKSNLNEVWQLLARHALVSVSRCMFRLVPIYGSQDQQYANALKHRCVTEDKPPL